MDRIADDNIFAIPNQGNDLVAQLVEQYTFNVWALGSSPSGITFNPKKPCNLLQGFFIFKAFNLSKISYKILCLVSMAFRYWNFIRDFIQYKFY